MKPGAGLLVSVGEASVVGRGVKLMRRFYKGG